MSGFWTILYTVKEWEGNWTIDNKISDVWNKKSRLQKINRYSHFFKILETVLQQSMQITYDI